MSGSEIRAVPDQGGVSSAGEALLAPLTDYVIDGVQRWTLFLDVLRRRGDTQIDMEARHGTMVLAFDHELVLDGRTLARPINYSLYRIAVPPGASTNPAKRPLIVVDPRAGQGAGIGGFKPESEIGDALAAGHPVYFIGFSATPLPGQGFPDVVEGGIAFAERVVALHPDAPRPTAIGNCQAGYQVLMAAARRPDLFGPCMVVGSPMSYWQGRRGTAPMRYLGGLGGGSWITAMLADLGAGRFDGAWLILNFDLLGLANFLWVKQYNLYAHVDEEADRYLDFEKWWGDFIMFNGEEIQYLVDHLFIGDELVRGVLTLHEGEAVDLHALTSPTVVLTSTRDQISPPPQTLGWILDLYRSVEEIRSAGRVIVYAVDAHAGHLGLFVSAGVAEHEDEEFVLAMEAIARLAPGLYEMVEVPPEPATGAHKAMRVRFENRTLEDIRVFGRNTPDEDAAFAAVAGVSRMNLALYRAVVQPVVRTFANAPAAECLRMLHPLRLSYSLLSSLNPWMQVARALAPIVADCRRPVAPDNPFLTAQETMSDALASSLDTWQSWQDAAMEAWFFAVYGSPFMQSCAGVRRSAVADGAHHRQADAAHQPARLRRD
ncbi:Uncharacterised protein [Starkeya nomas]|uniref:Poly(3-hydroxyalkanoate) synthetase n=1 Tax=Starkeya nomas TaxID=2666134 RepID=A0A5S9NK69_9HYPH|nr:DUF3141 domain-containing protein [Starkeya nomas]CAA0090259.1 Uncharacterised protein [Starkeya nomas]